MCIINQNIHPLFCHVLWNFMRLFLVVFKQKNLENSHAFLLPEVLRPRLGGFDTQAIEAELIKIQDEIDSIAFVHYGFSVEDRVAAQSGRISEVRNDEAGDVEDDGEDEDSAAPIDQTAGLLSWAVGVVFGRFDWHLATYERKTDRVKEVNGVARYRSG